MTRPDGEHAQLSLPIRTRADCSIASSADPPTKAPAARRTRRRTSTSTTRARSTRPRSRAGARTRRSWSGPTCAATGRTCCRRTRPSADAAGSRPSRATCRSKAGWRPRPTSVSALRAARSCLHREAAAASSRASTTRRPSRCRISGRTRTRCRLPQRQRLQSISEGRCRELGLICIYSLCISRMMMNSVRVPMHSFIGERSITASSHRHPRDTS